MDSVRIDNRIIGEGNPCFVVAEMSANHRQSYQKAVEILHAAKESGADAVKVQTYKPDTITINCDNKYFRIEEGPWSGQNLYQLYEKAYMPWEWHYGLKEKAEELQLAFFSSVFDFSSTDLMEDVGASAYKVASFEIIDTPLLEYIAEKMKPVIVSTGMATLGEIDAAVRSIRGKGNDQIVLLKCVSTYPAMPEEMNLKTMKNLSETFGCPIGLSDHSLGFEVAICAVALGACVIEKHFTLSRKEDGPDSYFSMEPQEFRDMVKAVRRAEKTIGEGCYEPSIGESKQKKFRRSLFVIRDVRTGEEVTSENVRSIRPAFGLPPHYIKLVLGRRFKRDVSMGTPMSFDLIDF